MNHLRRLALAASALAAPALAQDVPLGRLPDTVKPTAYRIDLKVDPEQAEYSGHVEIDAEVTTATRSIFLHGLGLKMARADVVAGGKTLPARYAEVDASGVARLDLDGPLAAGKVTLRFDYSTGFRDGAEGLFRAKVGGQQYAWTQMEPLDARRMFPGFDEPGFKLPFTISLTVPERLKAFANTPEVAAETRAGWTTHRFAPSKPLPTYLVAVGVGDFDVRETSIPANEVRKTPLAFRVIATKGQASRMDTTLTEAPKIVTILENYFGIPYPYEKLDFIASPVMGGAMENAGLIVYQDTLILLDKAAPPSQLRSFGTVVAHEVAHQWFGDLVTPSWWTDIWLNESFAEWMGNKAANRWRPDLGIAAGEVADAFYAMDTDSLGRGRPIRQPITRNDQVISAFDSITYLKGAQTVSMFEKFVGAEAFRKGVQLHLNRYAYRNATAEDFFASVGEASGNAALVPALRSFTDQTGVPLVTVGSQGSGLSLSQSRYLPLGVAADRLARRWQVPVCLARSGSTACHLLADEQMAVPALAGAGPIVPNADGAGYYRFTLDPAGWDALIAGLAALPEREAMVAADSIWADFAAGRLDFARVARAAEALAGHSGRLPALQLAVKLADLANSLLEQGDQAAYRALMGRLFTPRLAALGLDPAVGAQPGETAATTSLRESLVPIVALEARDADVRARLKAAASQYLAGNSGALAANFRRTALSVFVQDGGMAAADQLYAALKASDDPLFRSQAATALGRVEGDASVAHVQRLAMQDGLLSLERTTVLGNLAANRASRDATTAFVSANFTRVVESFPGFARTGIIGFFSGYCSPDAVTRVEALIRPNLATLGGGDLELAQTRERIGQCAALKAARGADISAALNGAKGGAQHH
ncbi:M1 family metallopeptidase [Sandarakinorhabdus cyanobacteriorum]|nr:M1 family metallopeptidase [Sandarakinorhabdus cyanobacteriorum]